ncbi:MAG: hypothetical protein CME70_16685 [Halobacteriovorax sp.]|nr:hypothetical protein [Halobacteriovorax sp.]
MEVEILSALDVEKIPIAKIKEIFFEASSIKEFENQNKKEEFFYRWCGQYLEKYPSHFLLAFENEELLGYSCSHPDSHLALEEFSIPGQELFKSLFDEYPLHLHINCHLKSRGKGVGKKLILSQARLNKKGIHIITEKSADNYGFYRALGFDREEEAELKGHTLLFMGRKSI